MDAGETHQVPPPQEVRSLDFRSRLDNMLDKSVTMSGTEVATAMSTMEVRLTTNLIH